MEPRNKDDERMAVRHADASGGDIIENQHDENRMRDIHVGKSGSDDEQLDKSRFEQETPLVALEYPASGETQDRPGSALVYKSGHIDDDTNFRVGCFLRDGCRVVTSEKCWIGIEEKMLEISREVN